MILSSAKGTSGVAATSTQVTIAPSIRRKPNITYHSPCGNVPAALRIEESVRRVHGVVPPNSGASTTNSAISTGKTTHTSTTVTTTITTTTTKDTKSVTKPIITSGKWKSGSKGSLPGWYTQGLRGTTLFGTPKTRAAALAMAAAAAALPLYHPLGKLALSLPELDAAALGLPVRMRVGDAEMRASSRARRLPAKLREVEEEGGEGKRAGGVVIAANTGPGGPVPVTSSSGKERERVGEGERERNISPRKRRGAGATGAKRRRREVDDGDATYPAKRTRNARGAAAAAAAAARAGSVETEVMAPGEDGDGGGGSGVSVPEGAGPSVVERRSRRARAPVRNRESSGSEGSGTSVSVSIAAGNTTKIKDVSETGKTDGAGLTN